VSRSDGRRVARRRAASVARGLRRDLQSALEEGVPPRAADLRTALRRLDAALDLGLRFDIRPDSELSYRRGHARNVALVLRRSLDEWHTARTPRLRADLLGRAIRFADELSGTVAWISLRVDELEVPPPARPWTRSWPGRLLTLVASVLPPEARVDFVEDQCGNLACIESRRERARYLLGLVAQAPRLI
jgi:hypothetical protein